MINWMYFPKNKKLDNMSKQVISVFDGVAKDIDSDTHTYKSDEVLAKVRPGLEACGFDVEKNKSKNGLISVPVLFGQNGRIEKSFDVDAWNESEYYVIEVEAGRAVANYQFLKDFFEACTMNGVDKLCIAVRNTYNGANDFATVCAFFEAMYASGRLTVPLSGILIIGY